MYLQALTLRGFKSFADPTTLRFEPGVTAIVGPNGCGKSNIADAIRWVLGEQSAKALRGGKMQDVIFEGVDTRKPAQLCEVSLLLTECEKQMGSEFHQIEIMRRGHRDGQGEYFFNGQPCRLKDIHKLFMDTGVGRTSYSIMAQGQIDQILSSKPDERRAVFEEAAGITKYKSQRREAMSKLALTEQNLARVTDIVGEVGRQIGSLRRQAAKAMRYKRLNHRLRHLSLAWSARQHAILSAVLAELDATVGGLRTAATDRRANLESQQAGLESKKTQRSRLNQRIQEAQQAAFDLRSEREQAENASNLARIRRNGLEERISSSTANFGELEMQLREVAAQVDTGAQDKQLQLNLLGSSDAVFQQCNRELAIADGQLSKIEEDLHQAKFDLLQVESTVARLRTDCSGYEVEQRTSAHKHEIVGRDLAGVRGEQEAAARAVEEIGARAEAALVEKNHAHEEEAAAQKALADTTREFRDAQRRLQDIDRVLAQRSARLKILQQLQERWEGFGEGAKALLQGRLASALEGQKAVPVLQGLEVAPDCGRALEALLGTAAEAIQVADVATARRILAKLEADQIGSAILRIGECGGSETAAEVLPPGLFPATSALANPDPNHPVFALLGSCYLADDLGGFLEFWKANPGFGFLAVATRKGEIVDRRGLVAGGHASSKKGANSLVQREIDIRETARAIAEEQKQHDGQKARIDALNAALAAAEKALESGRERVLSATQNSAAVQAEQRNAQRARDEVEGRFRRMEAELAGLEQARNEAQARWVKAQDNLAQAEAADAAQRSRIAQLETAIAAARADRDAKRDSLAQARLELAERRQKVEVLDRGLGEMERRRQQILELLTQRRHEIDAWTEQSAGLEKEAAAQRERAAQIAETLGVAQEQVEAIRGELVAIESEIGALESAQARVREEAEAAHEELSAHEVKLAENRQRAQFLAEEVAREFSTEIAGLDWKHLLWHAEDEPEGLKELDLDEEEAALPEGNPPREGEPADTEAARAPRTRRRRDKARGEPTESDLAALDATPWDDIKAQVDALRQRIGAMGAVNLVAIEEYVELKQRHDFLKNQSDDLTNAKAELLGAIDEINRTSQEQFSVTFEQIKKNFAYTFETLFGGGHALLELVQAEDILESGVEIIAQPPGTRFKNISLLSGGQKTLTAVALLFALYMVKPSPFCLLDELDAPLDESNIGRFTDLLRKFIKESQFIIITHNKRTVAAASVIYGVTMEERGVSKTVSMRFNHERGQAEVHTPNIAESVAAVQSAVPEPA
jgi:chromosome segregation protein